MSERPYRGSYRPAERRQAESGTPDQMRREIVGGVCQHDSRDDSGSSAPERVRRAMRAVRAMTSPICTHTSHLLHSFRG